LGRSPRSQVDIGQADLVEERITHVNDIGILPDDDAVAVGMRVRGVDRAYAAAVEKKRYAVLIGNDGQRGGSGFIAVLRLLGEQAVADMVLSQDQSPRLCEIRVSATMVAMPVGIDQETHRARTERGNRSLDLGRQRGELVVDQDGTVGAVRDADIAAGAEQHRDARRDDFGADLNGRKIALRLRGRGHRQRGNAGQCDGELVHDVNLGLLARGSAYAAVRLDAMSG